MTREEFIDTDPLKYGNGRVNLLISSSVVDPVNDLTPIPPYTLQGISLPDKSKNGVNIAAALREVDRLRFEFTEGQIDVDIIGRRKRAGYFYYLIEPVTVNTYPTDVGPSQEPVVNDSEFAFVPYVEGAFKNSDYNPIINNSEGSKLNSTVQVVDRFSGQGNPTNLTAILNTQAEPAEIQDCAYTKIGIINSRYNGSKQTNAKTLTEYNKQRYTDFVLSSGLPGNEPALGFRSFEGSLHSTDAPDATIRDVAERTTLTVYFNTTLTQSGSSYVYPNFPESGNILYEADGNKMKRIVNQRVYSTANDVIYSVSEAGFVTRIK
jgi:hypothetical protein